MKPSREERSQSLAPPVIISTLHEGDWVVLRSDRFTLGKIYGIHLVKASRKLREYLDTLLLTK
jgi:hypothetical protein